MSKVVVRGFSLSLDGFGAGPRQDLQNPLGVGGPEMFDWFMHTRTWQKMQGQDGGETNVDDEVAAQAMSGLGAWILGRNMFGPVRGPWPDESWRGWWGEEPPYHVPVFVLTHHARPPLAMKGNTTFHFVTDGIHSALEQAKKAAGERDVRIGGGRFLPAWTCARSATNASSTRLGRALSPTWFYVRNPAFIRIRAVSSHRHGGGGPRPPPWPPNFPRGEPP